MKHAITTDDLLEIARGRLLAELRPDGCWTGELSSSALATAVAVFALDLAGETEWAAQGRRWLIDHRNADGGWGDSPESPSNFTATLLGRCALDESIGPPEQVTRAMLEFYGQDRTFSVPVLTMCMLSGKLGDDWSVVPQLPFELAVFPHKFYRVLQLPVVSYALPVLIAIGLVRHHRKPVKKAFYRNALIPRVLHVLEGLQPESGGFLEAAPLSGFVAMSLIGAGFGDHPVARHGIRFLKETMREDGSWPIDVNLSTWVTSLSARLLADDLSGAQQDAIRNHLLQTQWKTEHPFTHADPGGWGWTPSAGGVPDADDTAAALMALHRLGCDDLQPIHDGIVWLMNLQNRDGGLPTFCRGWGKLPFDRSCPDLTAHMIRAFAAWRDRIDLNTWAAMEESIEAGLIYLEKQQRPDGSWIPLWFGSQHQPKQENPVYGTVRVLEALQVLNPREFPRIVGMAARGLHWLEQARNSDGSWGHTLEETALAAGMTGKGDQQLIHLTAQGTCFCAGPIGLYFASLWYSEKLYPLIFTVDALQRLRAARDKGA